MLSEYQPALHVASLPAVIAEYGAIDRNGPATAIESPGRHHFDVIYDLVAPGSVLGQAVCELIID